MLSAQHVAKILYDRFNYLGEQAWMQGRFAYDTVSDKECSYTDKFATCWCVSGLLYTIFNKGINLSTYAFGVRLELTTEFHRRFGMSVETYNDSHTFDELMAVLKDIADGN